MPRLSIWRSVPHRSSPNYRCQVCGKAAWFPVGTRFLAALLMIVSVMLGTWLVLPLTRWETAYPHLLIGVFVLALLAVGAAGMWLAGWLCSRSSYLVDRHFGDPP